MSAHFRSRRSPAGLKSSELFGLAAVFALLAALLYATVLAAPAGARQGSAPSRRELAERLLKLDPGRPLGGDTIVGVSNGDLLLGAANRVNVMIALGSGETIVGGNRADQLGALGKNATIRGGAGTDAIRGGAGQNVISGGAGNDRITDTKGSATINTGSGKNEVDVAGHPGRDRVLCAPGSVDRIHANHGDYIAPSCRKAAGSQLVYHQPPSTKPSTARNNGCTDNPNVHCTFLAASGTLPGSLWSWQKIPHRECPPSHPYLLFKDYLGFGVSGPFGVEVSNLGNINFFARRVVRSDNYVIGAFGGTVDNWTFSPQEWRMWFHCTSDISQGWKHGGS
jgi:Ca2+-binding RTX toxin-like protein